MIENEKIEYSKLLLELALNWGRRHKSVQTGYIHYFYGSHSGESHQPIPIVENFLYALALFRSRNVENINEAKQLLDGLLHFQNLRPGIGMGNFPIYLHEYPACKDRFLALDVATPLCWILKLFHQVLGQELKKKLEAALKEILKHILQTHAEKNAPYHVALKIAGAAKAGGNLLHDDEFKSQGENLLQELLHDTSRAAWFSPAAMGAMLTGLTLAYGKISESPWKEFWTHLEQTWHRQTCCYIGPAFCEWQYEGEPQLTLYDLFLGGMTDTLSKRMQKESSIHVEAALICACEDKIQMLAYLWKNKERCLVGHGKCIMRKRLRIAGIETGEVVLKHAQEKGFHPLRLVWGNTERVHTFVCQGGNSRSMHFNKTADGLVIAIKLAEHYEEEEREKCREVVFYIDTHEGLDFLVSGHKASTFLMNDSVSMQSDRYGLRLDFQLLNGTGHFQGHRMLGNRPSQVNLKGSNRYHAYDWLVFLRTVRRSSLCEIQVALKICESC